MPRTMKLMPPDSATMAMKMVAVAKTSITSRYVNVPSTRCLASSPIGGVWTKAPASPPATAEASMHSSTDSFLKRAAA